MLRWSHAVSSRFQRHAHVRRFVRRAGQVGALVVLCAATYMTSCTAEPEAPPVRRVRVSLKDTPIQPVPAVPALDARKVALGRAMYFDTRLSGDGTLSCASCHNIQAGGDDGLPTSVGIRGQRGPINAPTVLNAGLNIAQFWDGRAPNLKEQARGPVANPIEMGAKWPEVVARLRADKHLLAKFQIAYVEGLTEDTVVDAIATFEQTLVTPGGPFDRYLAGDQSAISAEAQRGYALFQDFGCVSCHQGRNVGGNMYQRFGVMGDYFKDRGNLTDVDLGRYNVTKKEEDKHIFRVPSLRNVERTAPYFHDGSVGSLEEAIRIMAKYQLGRHIEDGQVAAIAAFLKSLSGPLPNIDGPGDGAKPPVHPAAAAEEAPHAR